MRKLLPFIFFILLFFRAILIFSQEAQLETDEGLGKYDYIEKDDSTWVHWATTWTSWTSANVKVKVNNQTVDYPSVWQHDGASPWVKHLSTTREVSFEHFNATDWIAGAPVSLILQLNGTDKAAYANEMMVVDVVPQNITGNIQNASNQLVLQFSIDVGTLSGARVLKGLWVKNFGSLLEGDANNVGNDINYDKVKLYYETGTTFSFNGDEANPQTLWGDWGNSGNYAARHDNCWGNEGLNIPIPVSSTGKLLCYVVIESFNSTLTYGHTAQFGIMNDGMKLDAYGTTSKQSVRIDAHKNANVLPLVSCSDIIHYWSFNNSNLTPDISVTSPAGTITNDFITSPTSINFLYSGTLLNALTGTPAGVGMTILVNTAMQNNGKHLFLNLPTTDYKNVIVSYALRKSGNAPSAGTGFQSHDIYYSTDGGTNWVFFTNYSIPALAMNEFTLKTLDFSNTLDVENNPNFRVRFTMLGGSNSNGNNRFDNIKMNAIDINRPSISNANQPVSQTVCENLTATFTVVADGNSLNYQWYVCQPGGVWGIISGATSASYTTPATTLTMNGNMYYCEVWSSVNPGCNRITSNVVTLTVNASPQAPTSATSDRNNFCADDAGNITISATGGSGSTLQWFSGSCGGTSLGAGSGANNSITMASPAVTTTYYARWENTECGSSACASVTVTVYPNLPVSVSIAANQNNICAGTQVTYTATPTNGGTTPAFQWFSGSTPIGTGNPLHYTPINGEIITCVLTSSETCASGNPATSNAVIMTVIQPLAVSVSIAADPGNTICAGIPVTYTATPTNGGTTPSYQWYKNNSPVGSNQNTYTYNPSNGDQIYVVLTSNEQCSSGSPAQSNTITMTVNSVLAVSVSIAANPGNTVCAGTTVTYTAIPTNGGTTPSYQWKVNSTPAGSNSNTFTYVPSNTDVVTCELTSSETCTSGNPATSNVIAMTVNPMLEVSVSISADPGSVVCAGTNVVFTATPINGGTSPVYQWYQNGGPVGSNSPIYTCYPVNNDNIYCILTSSEPCKIGDYATSNSITMTVNDQLPVSVDVTANPGTSVCEGDPIIFTANVLNGGTSPTYQWHLNSGIVGGNSPTYILTTPADGDEVHCIVTSSFECATGNPATSNTLIVEITNVLPVSVTISADPLGTVCEGDLVTFTADANAGSSPAYDWKVNGISTGVTTDTYTPDPTLNNNDNVTCVVTSSSSCAINNPATSNEITMSVMALSEVVVTISADPPGTVCQGEQVSFTATVAHGGDSPVYAWKVNGLTMSSISSYSYLPNDGDVVVCEVISSESCVTPVPPLPAISNVVTMTVQASVDAEIDITSDPGSNVCENTLVTYSAQIVNGGSIPVYQWKVNGSNSGTNSNTFQYTPTNGDIITCELTSSIECVTNPTVLSNQIVMTVSSQLLVSVSISPSGTAQVCEGDPLTFTATPTNGGNAPTYEWFLNSSSTGITTATYILANPSDGDEVYCKVTSNILCAIGNPAQSPTTTVEISNNIVTQVSIDEPPVVCEGIPVTLTAIPVNGGTPSYQWYKNGAVVGSNQDTYTYVPVNGDQVYVVMTSSFDCATGNPATSNTVIINTTTSLPVSVTIFVSGNPGNTICEGTTVSFLADGQNGGANSTYEWFVNEISQGAASTINIFSYEPANNDMVKCTFTSDFTNCITGNPATSNLLTMQVAPLVDVHLSVSSSEGNNICEGTEVTFTATPVNSGSNTVYQWTVNGSPMGNDNSTFIYSPQNNDEVSCYIIPDVVCPSSSQVYATPIVFTVSDGALVSISITADPGTEVCQGDTVRFTAIAQNGGSNPSFDWQVNGITKTNDPVFYYQPQNADRIQCVFTSALLCATNNPATSESYVITVHGAPQINLSSEEYLCAGTPVVLDAGAGFASYLWQDGSVGETFTAIDKGIYWVQVTDGYGCIGSDSVEMKLCNNYLKLPNAFTPNGDGLNDRYNGLIDPEEVTKYQLRVYNRWGELLYEGKDPYNGWDGTKKGELCPYGAYLWEVTYDTQNSQGKTVTEHKRGTVMLIR